MRFKGTSCDGLLIINIAEVGWISVDVLSGKKVPGNSKRKKKIENISEGLKAIRAKSYSFENSLRDINLEDFRRV